MKFYITGEKKKTKPAISKKNTTEKSIADKPWIPPSRKRRPHFPPPPPHAVRIPHYMRPNKQPPPRQGDIYSVVFVDEIQQKRQIVLIQTNSPKDARLRATYVKLAEGFNFKLSTIPAKGIPFESFSEAEQKKLQNGVVVLTPEDIQKEE